MLLGMEDCTAAVSDQRHQYVSESRAITCALRALRPALSGTGRRSRALAFTSVGQIQIAIRFKSRFDHFLAILFD